MFFLLDSNPLFISFDPIQAEDKLPSVAFNITAKWTMPFQQCVISLRETWFEDATLRRFESDLVGLLNRQSDSVELKNMHEHSVLTITSVENIFTLKFVGRDTAKTGEIILNTDIYEEEVTKIIENIKNWDKWW